MLELRRNTKKNTARHRNHVGRLIRLEGLEDRVLMAADTSRLSALVATANPAGDDYGNTTSTAATLVLGSNGSGSASGQVGKSGDKDFFNFTAVISGMVTVDLRAASGSTLDTTLTVYNSSGRQLAFNDDSGRSDNSHLQFRVTAGQTYYLAAAGHRKSVGGYTLDIAGPVVQSALMAQSLTSSITSANKTASIQTAAVSNVTQSVSQVRQTVKQFVNNVTVAAKTLVDEAKAGNARTAARNFSHQVIDLAHSLASDLADELDFRAFV